MNFTRIGCKTLTNLLFLAVAMVPHVRAGETASPDSRGDEAAAARLAGALKELQTNIFPEAKRADLASMVRENLRSRLQAANDRSRSAWSKINNREQWERFRKPRLDALRKSLGDFPDPPPVEVRVTGRVDGDGYRIENLLFRSRPGLYVTANLYLPETPAKSMPGILICHSHHRPKEHGELQDMGMTWARHGCAVLVMDQLGHGERRQHPFKTAADYEREFRVTRQDYYFRYDTGMQLHLVGESLIGWMVWDLMRGVDLLLARPDIDPQRIMLLGAVAGGGDPAAVAAALDPRIAAAVPFNFGGPQPETRYPLPEDAETSFNYAGSGSWESTRNLRRSAADGFLPWVIVGSIAPRRLVFAHEFNWHRERDPVWKRLQKIYDFFDERDHLAYAHGRGELRGRPPEATHCTHIGRVHRVMIHSAFGRWFDMRVAPEDESSARVDEERLLCLTPAAARELKPRRLCDLLPEMARERAAAARRRLASLPPPERGQKLREYWSAVLGNVDPCDSLRETGPAQNHLLANAVRVSRVALETEPGITVPLLLLVPNAEEDKPAPVVVAVAQAGKAALVRDRADALADLLQAGIAVCLPDLRGTGETRAGSGRGRYSADTPLSSTQLMLGDTVVGARLRDLRSVLRYLRGRKELDSRRIAVWGDSLAEVNSPDRDFHVPRHMDGRPRQPEPLGGLLALLSGLYEEDVRAVCVHGGLVSFHSVLESQFVLIPHDTVIPGVLTTGDLCELAAVLAPRPLRLGHLVDGWNRRLTADRVHSAYEVAVASYRAAGETSQLVITAAGDSPAAWLQAQLKQP